jgi:hypothetical protein
LESAISPKKKKSVPTLRRDRYGAVFSEADRQRWEEAVRAAYGKE